MTFSPNDDDRFLKSPQYKGWFRFSTPKRYLVFLLIIIFFTITLWYFLFSRRPNYNHIDLALIRADETPFKIKAKDQGVPNITHQDKLVYGRISHDQQPPSAEHILPDPELPFTQTEEESSVKMVEQYLPKNIDFEKVDSSLPEPSKDLSSTMVSIEDLIEKTQEDKAVPLKKVEKGNILIQLGSLKSYDLAEAEWARILEHNKDILEGLEPAIQKVDLGADRGIFYRLRTGVENKETAIYACTTLKAKKVDCLVVQ
ncbi:MAG: SPOR domain-containing protein [Alphaproteobacteria bacterium]|nr:SPOR domain-containing protein [Alphaproteobacteria bacterium]